MNAKPIDPSDANGRLRLYSLYEVKAGKTPTRSQMAAIHAIVRGVLPEGYVAVPIEDLKLVISGSKDFRTVEAESAAIRCVRLIPGLDETIYESEMK